MSGRSPDLEHNLVLWFFTSPPRLGLLQDHVFHSRWEYNDIERQEKQYIPAPQVPFQAFSVLDVSQSTESIASISKAMC